MSSSNWTERNSWWLSITTETSGKSTNSRSTQRQQQSSITLYGPGNFLGVTCLLTRCVPWKYLSGLVARYPTKLKPHFARYGITDTVVTDSGPQSSSREFADFATSNPQTPSERQDSKRLPDGSFAQSQHWDRSIKQPTRASTARNKTTSLDERLYALNKL